MNMLVSTIDKTLRARQGIFEYSNCVHCVFRIHVAAAATDIDLLDGTHLPAGSRLIHLHLWHEHIPRFAGEGPTLAWARQICADVELSLGELAAFLASRPALDDVVAIRANMVCGSPREAQFIAQFAVRYGFVHAANPAPSRAFWQRLHLLGENILISMIVISQNPSALRMNFLRRDRVPLYLRRADLLRRFGTRDSRASTH